MAGNLFTVIKPTADILATPDSPQIISKSDSQLLFGESFNVIEARHEWLRGVSVIDDYEGFIHVAQIAPQAVEPTHFVDVCLTHIYPQPDFKTRPLTPLSFLSRLTPTGETENGFVEIEKGWVFAEHIKPLTKLHVSPEIPLQQSESELSGVYAEKTDSGKSPGSSLRDVRGNNVILNTAKLFLGAPYLYGGRSALGIDCSGLVQLCLIRSGLSAPRDSGPQAEQIGSPIDQSDLQAGDFVFFDGHVGIMTDAKNILNATARTMDTRIEPLSNLIDFYGDITATRRV